MKIVWERRLTIRYNISSKFIRDNTWRKDEKVVVRSDVSCIIAVFVNAGFRRSLAFLIRKGRESQMFWVPCISWDLLFILRNLEVVENDNNLPYVNYNKSHHTMTSENWYVQPGTFLLLIFLNMPPHHRQPSGCLLIWSSVYLSVVKHSNCKRNYHFLDESFRNKV